MFAADYFLSAIFFLKILDHKMIIVIIKNKGKQINRALYAIDCNQPHRFKRNWSE